MKRGKGLSLFLIVLIFGIITIGFIGIVSATQTTINLNGDQVKEIANKIRDMKGWPLTADCSGIKTIDYYFYGTDATTRDKLCFYSNYSSNSVVSGKKMISGSYVGIEGGGELNADIDSECDNRFIKWNSGWTSLDSSGSNWLKLNDPSEYITCNVNYADYEVEWKVVSFSSNNDGWCQYDVFKEIGMGYDKSRTIVLNSGDNLKTAGLVGNLYTKTLDSAMPENYMPYIYMHDTYFGGNYWAGIPVQETAGIKYGIMATRQVTDSSFSLSPVYEIDLYDWYEGANSRYNCKNVIRYAIGSCVPLTCQQDICGTSIANGCGTGTISCGCTNGKTCSNGLCVSNNLCTNVSQTIMKLDGSSNSLGALWNDSYYNYSLCYDEIFGKNYTGTNPHDCNGINKLINLKESNYSRAEISSLSNYNVPICYGDLNCRAVVSNDLNCDSDEKTIVRLENETNSFISNSTYSGFPIKICCKTLSVTGANWTNMMNELIVTHADLEDSVKASVRGIGFDGKNISYTIYKDIPWWFDKKISQSSTNGYLVWKAGVNSSGVYSLGNYYFIAEVDGNRLTSGNLEVVNGDNQLPSTTIVKPIEDSKYVIKSTGKTNTVLFEQISSDDDDDLNATWDFTDRQNQTIAYCLTTGNCNTTHEFNVSGVKHVQLTVKEATRDQSNWDRKRVYVYKENLTMMVVFDSPSYREKINAGAVLMNATSAHVVNCSFTKSVCDAGSRAKLNQDCYNVTDNIDPNLVIWCYNAADSSNPHMTFQWTFDDIPDNNHTNSTPFTHIFMYPKQDGHNINLKVSIDTDYL